MKKLFISVAIVLFFIVACPDDATKIERIKEDAIEACAECNFEKARNAVEKIQTMDSSRNKDYNECIQIVNDKEIHYLLASNSKDDANRVMYLYNTYGKEQLPDMSDVLEVAISQDNDYLAEKLIKGGVELTEKSRELIKSTGNKELNEHIIDMDIATLKDVTLPLRPNIGKIRVCTDSYRNAKGCPMIRDLKEYVQAVHDFNSECIKLIRMAMEANLKTKAKEVYSLMKPNITYTFIGECKDDRDFSNYSIQLDRTQINETATLIKE